MRFPIRMYLYGLLLVSAAFAEGSFSVGTNVSLGVEGAPKASVFAVDTVDFYSSNWRGLQIPLETGRNYETIDPFFDLYFGGAYKDFSVYFNFPLRKDIEAWYEDDYSSNVTLSPDHLDINVPTEGYAKWVYGAGFLQAGRFKPEMGPSPNTLALGGAPYHDAILWNFSPSIFRYDFFISSLNSHLHGTPSTVGGEVTDTTSEVWKQANLEVDNQRNRSYTEPYKTLVYHRVGVDLNFAWLYIIEQSVIGGKQVEFRTINPFMFWHDNYASGYTKANVTLELGFRPTKGGSFYYQMGIDDIKSPVGETGKNSTRGILSYLVGYNQKIDTKSWGSFDFRLDAVYTDPAAGNERLPLLKYTSRRMYRSNYRDQSDADFADMFFVDYPLGYRRGPDAKDLWFTTAWNYGRHSVELELAWLRQGDKDLYTDYDEAVVCKQALSGVVERQYILDLTYKASFWKGLQARLGGGVRHYRNLDHIEGADGFDFWLTSGISLNFFYSKDL
ncbi:MAG: hypothetical protein M0P13_00780 [Fibrobacteraceae bacterium]|nr:hypothetical protein [Fibrobacteraceae bacterium]